MVSIILILVLMPYVRRQRMKQPEKPKSEQLDNIDLSITPPTKSNLKSVDT
jgi:hypothetical protein